MPCHRTSIHIIIRPVFTFEQNARVGLDTKIPPPTGNLAGRHRSNSTAFDSEPMDLHSGRSASGLAIVLNVPNPSSHNPTITEHPVLGQEVRYGGLSQDGAYHPTPRGKEGRSKRLNELFNWGERKLVLWKSACLNGKQPARPVSGCTAVSFIPLAAKRQSPTYPQPPAQ